MLKFLSSFDENLHGLVAEVREIKKPESYVIKLEDLNAISTNNYGMSKNKINNLMNN